MAIDDDWRNLNVNSIDKGIKKHSCKLTSVVCNRRRDGECVFYVSFHVHRLQIIKLVGAGGTFVLGQDKIRATRSFL